VPASHRSQDYDGKPDKAVLEIRYRPIRLEGRNIFGTDTSRGARNAEEQKVDRLEADHRSGCTRLKDAIEKLESQGSQMRRAEDAKLWTARRLANLIVHCIVSWRNAPRSTPDTQPALAPDGR
jgi:hypothetical protein